MTPWISSLRIFPVIVIQSILYPIIHGAAFSLPTGVSSAATYYAECSPVNTIGAYFSVTTSRPAFAIHLLPKSAYDEMVRRWDAGERGFTPNTGGVANYGCREFVSSCERDTGPTLPPDVYCVTVYKNIEDAVGLNGTVTRTFTAAGSGGTPSPSPSARGLDGGAIAGIVIGCVAVVVAIVGIIVYVRRNKRQAPPPRPHTILVNAPVPGSIPPGSPMTFVPQPGNTMSYYGAPITYQAVPIAGYPSYMEQAKFAEQPPIQVDPQLYTMNSAMMSPPEGLNTMMSPPEGLEGQFVQGTMPGPS